MKSIQFGVSLGLAYFGLAMLGAFNGIEEWARIVGTISVGLAIAVFVEWLR